MTELNSNNVTLNQQMPIVFSIQKVAEIGYMKRIHKKNFKTTVAKEIHLFNASLNYAEV